MTETEFNKKLQQKIEALQKDSMPNRDLWFGIEQAISKESTLKKTVFAAAAAVSLLFLGAGFLLTNGLEISPNSQPISALAEQHQTQKVVLLNSYQNYQPLIEGWDKQMQELDVAEKAIMQAIKENPENTALLTMLKHIHSKQISFINRTHKPYIQQPTSI